MANSLSLRDLADQLAASLSTPEHTVAKAKAYEVLGEVFETIGKTAMGGGKVSVFGFGTFSCKERKARTGRNPQTGAPLKIAASKSLGFKPGAAQKKKAAAKKK